MSGHRPAKTSAGGRQRFTCPLFPASKPGTSRASPARSMPAGLVRVSRAVDVAAGTKDCRHVRPGSGMAGNVRGAPWLRTPAFWPCLSQNPGRPLHLVLPRLQAIPIGRPDPRPSRDFDERGQQGSRADRPCPRGDPRRSPRRRRAARRADNRSAGDTATGVADGTPDPGSAVRPDWNRCAPCRLPHQRQDCHAAPRIPGSTWPLQNLRGSEKQRQRGSVVQRTRPFNGNLRKAFGSVPGNSVYPKALDFTTIKQAVGEQPAFRWDGKSTRNGFPPWC
jgi:hypothetical protein